ncbi:hypothetical protein Tco_1264404 [Tanacetum coccineum]
MEITTTTMVMVGTISVPTRDFKHAALKSVACRGVCPSNEMEKFETEFWNNKMVGANHAGYTDRFHKLVKLVPHLVTHESSRIKSHGNYGLKVEVKDGIIASAWNLVHRSLTFAEFSSLSGIVPSTADIKDYVELADGKNIEVVFGQAHGWKYSFYTGQKFTTPKEAKDRVYLHSIESRRNLKLYKNDGVRISARCDGKVHVFTMSQGTGPTGLNRGMNAGPSGSTGPTTRSSKKRKNIGTNDDSQASSSILDAHDKGDLMTSNNVYFVASFIPCN